MAELESLPLFPLNTVLFPGMVLPLHIFEPRYKLMISECIQANKPFGVVLIREGREVGGPAKTYDFGTSAYITQVERLPDERMNIQSVGYHRFRIHSLEGGKPYQVGLVEDAPLSGEGDPEVQELAAALVPQLRAYFARLKEASASNISLDTIPDAAPALAFLTAILLPLRVEEKQALLEAESLAGMLKREHVLLRREMMLVEHLLFDDVSDDRSTPFSLN